MKIGQYCQRQRCRHVELEQFWQAFASRGFVSDSWAFLLSFNSHCVVLHSIQRYQAVNIYVPWTDISRSLVDISASIVRTLVQDTELAKSYA